MRAALLFALLLCVACAPDLTTKASRVTQARVVAVRAEPAEAKPNAQVTWTAVVVTPEGAVMDAPVDWAFCLVPRSPTDSSSISTICLGDGTVDAGLPDGGLADGGDAGPPPAPVVVPVMGTGHTQVRARIPMDACAKVGPQVPPASMDGTRQRPPDPDVTGGYYLPIRLTTTATTPDGDSTDVSFARQRLRCTLPDVPGQTAADFAARYVNNVNPVMGDVTVAGALAPTDATPVPVDATQPIELVGSWTPESIEDYVAVNPETRELDDRTESMEMQWYTNGGAFAHDRTTANSDLLTSTNTLTIDADHVGPVTVWIVLKDERGGVAFRVLVLTPA